MSADRAKKAYEAVKWKSMHSETEARVRHLEERNAFLEEKAKLMDLEFDKLRTDRLWLRAKTQLQQEQMRRRRQQWRHAHQGGLTWPHPAPKPRCPPTRRGGL